MKVEEQCSETGSRGRVADRKSQEKLSIGFGKFLFQSQESHQGAKEQFSCSRSCRTPI